MNRRDQKIRREIADSSQGDPFYAPLMNTPSDPGNWLGAWLERRVLGSGVLGGRNYADLTALDISKQKDGRQFTMQLSRELFEAENPRFDGICYRSPIEGLVRWAIFDRDVNDSGDWLKLRTSHVIDLNDPDLNRALVQIKGLPIVESHDLNLSAVVAQLVDHLGMALTAYIGQADGPRIVREWISGKRKPDPATELKLRVALQTAISLYNVTGDDLSIPAWFSGWNSELGDDSPADVIRDASDDDATRLEALLNLAVQFTAGRS
jgi:hypothetical protein